MVDVSLYCIPGEKCKYCTASFTVLGGVKLTNQLSDWLSICFDVGGIIGAVVVGGISDLLGARAVTITSLLYLAVPVVSPSHLQSAFLTTHVAMAMQLFIYRYYGATSIAVTVGEHTLQSLLC